MLKTITRALLLTLLFSFPAMAGEVPTFPKTGNMLKSVLVYDELYEALERGNNGTCVLLEDQKKEALSQHVRPDYIFMMSIPSGIFIKYMDMSYEFLSDKRLHELIPNWDNI